MTKEIPLQVPESMKALYDEITTMNDAFCKQYLNDDYAELARKMAATLARKRPSPLLNGRANGWAAGILYTLGQVNFLFDKSQSPHMRADELCKRIGVSQQTASGRAQKIREILEIFQMHPDWTLPGLADQNPLTWILSVNGMLVDIRHMPREAQVVAFEQGLIPYIPADREEK